MVLPCCTLAAVVFAAGSAEFIVSAAPVGLSDVLMRDQRGPGGPVQAKLFRPGCSGSLAALRPVEDHPGGEIRGEFLEAMLGLRRGEDQVAGAAG